MRAFHGDPAVKEKYLARVKAHREADEIIKGLYWEDGKGCAVGCTIHGDDHQAYETELGIPARLAHLQDWIFENLPNGEAKDFPVDFLEAIPVGADLELVLHRFLHWLLVDPKDGVIQYAQNEEEEQVKEAILAVADLHYRAIKGQEVTNEQWDAAWASAWAADRDAARDAARAAARAAARDAARDADRDAAWDAARAAARAAAGDSVSSAAWASAIKKQKEKLLELLAGEGGDCE